MEKHLELVAKSYDLDIERKNKGYDNLPDYITNDPGYIKWKTEMSKEMNPQPYKVECKKEIKDYFSPEKDMKFIQFGCSVNLIYKGYDKWPSTYYGVDISSKTIQLLNDFVINNNLSIGSLYCGSIHETPFNDSYFDIGECIGVLEYYGKDFVEKAVKEVYRVLKPNGKFVLDIPNIKSPSGRVMMMIEEYNGRPEKFDMLPHEFEYMIKDYFIIEEADGVGSDNMGIGYYLRSRK